MSADTDAVAAQADAKKKQRSRQSAGDMVRSLGVVMAIVVVVFYFAQPPDSDKQTIRVIDPTQDIRSFARAAPAALVPGPAPEGWLSNAVEQLPGGLRVGWNIPPTGDPGYVEYAATTGPSQAFVDDLTGQGVDEGAVDVAGAPWNRYVTSSGVVSYVRRTGDVTVVIGTRRAQASEDALRLAISRLVPASSVA